MSTMSEDDKNKNNANGTSTCKNEEGSKWIVAVLSGADVMLASSSDRSAGKVLGEIVALKDPSTGARRDYVVMKSPVGKQQETFIMELQDIPSDFSSFMVGRHIVKDGSLYMVNRVDPLFFFLAAQEHHLQDQQTKKSWQPYEQCLEEASRNKSSSLFPKEIHAAITAEQLKHLCLTFENDEGIYFRFDATKALQFLKRKQERVLECLIRQDQIEQRRKDKLYELSFNQYNSGRASTSDNFTSTPSKSESDENETGENDQSNASSSPAVVISDTKALKLQSIQILCSYLSETWLEKFVEHLGVTMDQVQNKPSKVSAKNDTSSNSSTTPAAGYSIQKVIETENAEAATNAARVAAEKKTLESYRTPGNKRLAKVSTKGMKSIASFFGGAPKSKKAKHS